MGQRLRDERERQRGAHLRRRHHHGPVTAGARLWRGVAARGIHVPVGADGADVLQRHAARVFVGKGEAGGVLKIEGREECWVENIA